MKKYLFLLLVLAHLVVFSQGEANNWYFGEGAGINFNGSSNSPIVIGDGSLITNEGCSSISDEIGNLLFYSDGSTVWDRDNNPMPNGTGLKGNSSSTQSALIVPNPKDPSLYYLFTVGAVFGADSGGSPPGLNFYTIDMTLNGGFGDVLGVSENLSQGFDASWTEKITAVQTDQCDAFWVISLQGNKYYSYYIDALGVNTNPVISVVDDWANDFRGYLKVSPDGTKLAAAHYNFVGIGNGGSSRLILYSFDNVSGEVSNDGQIIFDTNGTGGIGGGPGGGSGGGPGPGGSESSFAEHCYGVEFSIRGKLYTSTYDGFDNRLYQFDLSSSDIAASKTLIHTQGNSYRGALQLASDGKIYTTTPISYDIGAPYLNAINNPDGLSLACDFEPEAVLLGSGLAMQGLPPFIQSFFINSLNIINNGNETTDIDLNLCTDDLFRLSTDYYPSPTVYVWSKDGVMLPNSNNYLDITGPGLYRLIIDKNDGSCKEVGDANVTYHTRPIVIPILPYKQCDFDENQIDGITIFNLEIKENELKDNIESNEVYFYENATDYVNGDFIDPEIGYKNTIPFNPPPLIVEVVTEFGCSEIGSLELEVFATSLTTYDDMISCETDSDNTGQSSVGLGLGLFNFDNQINYISDLFLPNSVTIELYENDVNASLQIDKLIGELSFSDGNTIYVRVENKLNLSCDAVNIGTFRLFVNPLPKPKGDDLDIILCVNNPRDNPQLFYETLDGTTGVFDDTYQWYLNNNLITGAINSTFDAVSEGNYRIEVTRIFNRGSIVTSCTGYNTFNVIESNSALLLLEDITVIDDSNNNSIEINTANLGIGVYEFSLDDVNGPFQENPIFKKVPAGIHTIYIRDENGCGIFQIKVSVIGFPNFFTPNNDGYNDRWSILGIDSDLYTSSEVKIFDRFGKIIAVVDPVRGWDGYYNGVELPATDYWFTAQLTDRDGNVRDRKGHFSLIRR